MPLNTLEDELRHAAAVNKHIRTPALRNYLAAQALRSHYIIALCPMGTEPAFVAKLCYDIADEFIARSIRPSFSGVPKGDR